MHLVSYNSVLYTVYKCVQISVVVQFNQKSSSNTIIKQWSKKYVLFM